MNRDPIYDPSHGLFDLRLSESDLSLIERTDETVSHARGRERVTTGWACFVSAYTRFTASPDGRVAMGPHVELSVTARSMQGAREAMLEKLRGLEIRVVG